jgi:hypothetical protein
MLSLLLSFVAASLAQTITLDGLRDTAYGSALTLQTVETTYGNNQVSDKFHFFFCFFITFFSHQVFRMNWMPPTRL